ncbi:TPA: hypothetical protein DEP21_04115 [Patescibacteria group bacterium]|nr:hypothetical protein [Candidatus Gracilibacteria bacterium]
MKKFNTKTVRIECKNSFQKDFFEQREKAFQKLKKRFFFWLTVAIISYIVHKLTNYNMILYGSCTLFFVTIFLTWVSEGHNFSKRGLNNNASLHFNKNCEFYVANSCEKTCERCGDKRNYLEVCSMILELDQNEFNGFWPFIFRRTKERLRSSLS